MKNNKSNSPVISELQQITGETSLEKIAHKTGMKFHSISEFSENYKIGGQWFRKKLRKLGVSEDAIKFNHIKDTSDEGHEFETLTFEFLTSLTTAMEKLEIEEISNEELIRVEAQCRDLGKCNPDLVCGLLRQ